MTTTKRETGEEIKARVLVELAKHRPVIAAAVEAGKPNADRLACAADYLEAASPSWYLSMRDGIKDPAKPWITKGLDSAGDLLRALVAEGMGR